MGCSENILRWKFIAIQSYLKKQEKHWINNLTLHLKLLEKEEQKKPKISRRKEIIKVRAEITEKAMKETIVKINKTKVHWKGCSFHVHGVLKFMVFIRRTDVEAETSILWPPDAKSWLIWKYPDAGKDWRREEKRMTEDETVGWHHRLNGHEVGWTPGVGDGQGGLACCSSWGHKESDMTEWLNWIKLKAGSLRR